MRQISISSICGCMLFYVMPVMSIELLMLEQQLMTLTRESEASQRVREIIKDSLILEINSFKAARLGYRRKQSEPELTAAFKQDILIPLGQDGHLNWAVWLQQSSTVTESQYEALQEFFSRIGTLFRQIVYLGATQDIGIRKTKEFNQLVHMIEQALPAENKRTETKQHLLTMWKDLISANITSVDDKTKKETFLKKYPDFELWMTYFDRVPNYALCYEIIFNILNIATEKEKKQYEQANKIFTRFFKELQEPSHWYYED
jgi:hypothetical protein